MTKNGNRKKTQKVFPPDGDDWREHLEATSTPEEIAAIDAQAKLLWDIIRTRKESGLTQQAISAKTGITQAALSKIESGDADARISTLLRFLAPLGKRLAIVNA